MGRAKNSFSSIAGHAEETSDETKVTLPEKDLWVAVLCRAALDACKGPPQLDMNRKANISHKNHYSYNKDQARHFFMEGGSHFKLICELAGRNPEYVQAQVRKVILRKNGWNVDVSLTSHYSQGPKKGRGRNKYRKTHPAGNAYYTAMGKKGGRPKLYGV